jgi:hypothetical protein
VLLLFRLKGPLYVASPNTGKAKWLFWMFYFYEREIDE